MDDDRLLCSWCDDYLKTPLETSRGVCSKRECNEKENT